MKDNHEMDEAELRKVIASNLDSWMLENESLRTLEKLAARSGTSYGTVQRMRSGEGNSTRSSMVKVAAAFGKTIEQLMTPPGGQAPASIQGHQQSNVPPECAELWRNLNKLPETDRKRYVALIARDAAEAELKALGDPNTGQSTSPKESRSA